MKEVLTKSQVKYWINYFVVVYFMFGFGKIGAIGAISDIGMQILGIFLGLIWGWMFIEMFWPSLMCVIALGLSDYMTMDQALKEGFGNSTVWLVFFCLIFAAYLEKSGLNTAMANWFIRRKICLGRPWVFSLMLLIAAYFLGATVSLFAAIVLSWNLFYRVCKMAQIKPGDPYAVLMVIGLCYAACLGVSILAFKPIPLIVYDSVQAYTGITVNYFQFMVVSFAISFVCLIIYWAIICLGIRPDVGKISHAIESINNETHAELNFQQKTASAFLIIFFLLLFLPNLLPEDFFFYDVLNRLTPTGTVCLVVLMICSLFKKEHRLGEFAEYIKNGVSWDLVFAFVAIMPLSSAMGDDRTGIFEQISLLTNQIFNHMSPFVFALTLLLVVLVLSQFVYNVIVATIFSPLMCMYAAQIDIPINTMTVLMCFALAMALCTPLASGMAAMMYGNSEWLTRKDVLKYTILATVINYTVMIVIGFPVGLLIIG